MNPCVRLSDRMPEVAMGRGRWTAEEATHLERCADCRAEWALVTAARRVAERAPEPTGLDALAEAVLGRLERERHADRRYRRWGVRLGMAAALAALAWAGVRELNRTSPAGPAAPAEIALPELETLETAELDSLLQTMDEAPAGWSALVEPTLGELDAEELEQVLGTWEG